MFPRIPSFADGLILLGWAGYWVAYAAAWQRRQRALRSQRQIPRQRDALACVAQAIAASIAVLLVAGYLLLPR